MFDFDTFVVPKQTWNALISESSLPEMVPFEAGGI